MLNQDHFPVDGRDRPGKRAVNEPSNQIPSEPLKTPSLPPPQGMDLGKEEISPAVRAALFARSLPPDHPILKIRDSACSLFNSLEEFISKNTRPPADMGYRASRPDTARVDEVLAECDRTIEVSTPIVTGTAIDQPSVMIQSGAIALRTVASKLRAFLIFGGHQDGVAEDRLAGVVSECMNYQNPVTAIMNDFSSLACGLAVNRD